MGKFTDSPYFLIDHYLETINIQLEEDIKSKIEILWPVIFTDWDSVEFRDYNSIIWNFEYETVEGSYSKKKVDYSYQASYLWGAGKTIIARGGRIIELFVKDNDFGFRQINVTPPWGNYKNGNFFNFHKHITLPFQYGSTLTETVSGNSFYFEVYTPTVEFDPDDINGKEIYFRKDSQFHDWLINYARDYFIGLWGEDFVIRNYVNTDKQFLYFGQIYHKHDDEYHIEFYGMKDFVELAIPYHQRTPNFKEFINVEFDRVYQEAYNLLKNIWSMIDPYEVDEKFLGYLARFYNINVDNQAISTLNQREFIRELTQYLKRKGSYSSFYAAWKVLTQGTKNQLYIYDKWLNRNIFETVPTSGGNVLPTNLQSVLYTEQYTGSFPLSGGMENYILTPYYNVTLDISVEPIEYNKILSSGIISSLLYQWEELRPVNKVSEYEILLKPEVDLTGNVSALYPGDQDRYNTNVLSSVSKFTISVPNAHIQVFGGDFTSFLINHNLNADHLLVRCYDMTFNEVVPSDIIFVDSDNIRVTFAEPLNGFMLVKKPDQTILQIDDLDESWRIKHQFSQKELYIEFNKLGEKIYSDSVELMNDEYIVTSTLSGAANISKPDLVYLQSSVNTVWTINHDLGYKGILISCFDINNNEIIPSKIEFLDIDGCEITFEEPVNGYAILVSVGNPLFADMLLERVIIDGEVTYLLPYYEVSSIIDKFETHDYKGRVTGSYENDEALYLIIDLPQNIELTIREMRIYDSNSNILIYTECGEIHKPMGVKMRVEYKVNKYTTKGSL